MTLRVLINHFSLLLLWGCVGAKADEGLKIDGSNGVRPLVSALTEAIQKGQENDAKVRIDLGGGMKTGERLAALNSGEIDLATASHGIDKKKLAPYDFEVFRIADMAVVFAVHKTVVLSRPISSEDIVTIYSGVAKNWKEFGGPDLPIVRLMRPEDEVDTEIIRREVDGLSDLIWAEGTEFHAKSGDLARALASTPGAIGVTTLIRANNSASIAVLPLNGVEPSVANVRDGSYSLTRGIFLVAPKHPTDAALRFLYFAGSRDGRRALTENHSIPCGLCQVTDSK